MIDFIWSILGLTYKLSVGFH